MLCSKQNPHNKFTRVERCAPLWSTQFPIGLSVILKTSKVYVRIYHKCLPPTVWNLRFVGIPFSIWQTINTKAKVVPCSLWWHVGCKHSSTYSQPPQQTEMTGLLHVVAALPPETIKKDAGYDPEPGWTLKGWGKSRALADNRSMISPFYSP